jgi:CRP-like cAMP-binding protein
VETPLASTREQVQSDLQELIERALPGCRPATYRVLLDSAITRSVARDEMVFRHGEPIPLTLVTEGYGAFRRTTIDGQVLTLGIAYPGDLSGLSSMTSASSAVDLVALTDARVMLWRGAELRRLVGIDPGLGLAAIERLSSFLFILTEKVDGFLHQDARRRVIRILARHSDLFFGKPAVLSRSHLPSLVGTSREMTGRVLRELEREGTIARVGRTGLQLLRPERLESDVAKSSRG